MVQFGATRHQLNAQGQYLGHISAPPCLIVTSIATNQSVQGSRTQQLLQENLDIGADTPLLIPKLIAHQMTMIERGQAKPNDSL